MNSKKRNGFCFLGGAGGLFLFCFARIKGVCHHITQQRNVRLGMDAFSDSVGLSSCLLRPGLMCLSEEKFEVTVSPPRLPLRIGHLIMMECRY